LKDSDKDFITFWEQKRQKGRTKYALYDGLRWSLFTVVFVILFQYFVLETTDPQNLWLSIAINVVVLLAAGFVLYYYLMWMLYERKYLKLKSSTNED
jgi:Flp pilus assembly protein TadB